MNCMKCGTRLRLVEFLENFGRCNKCSKRTMSSFNDGVLIGFTSATLIIMASLLILQYILGVFS